MADNLPITGGDAVSRELAKISHVAQTDPVRYRCDEGMQKRRRDLIDAQLQGSKSLPKGNALAARKAAITAMMKDRSSAYYRGSNALALQQEYRDIIDAERSGKTELQRDGAGNRVQRVNPPAKTTPTKEKPAERNPGNDAVLAAINMQFTTPAQLQKYDPALAKVLSSNGVPGELQSRMGVAQGNFGDVIGSLVEAGELDGRDGVKDAQLFVARFEALPLALRHAVIAELSFDAPIHVEAASSEQVAAWRQAGAAEDFLARTWGALDTPHNLGIIRRRIGRIEKAVGNAHLSAMAAFLNSLSAEEICAVYLTLVHGAEHRRAPR